jgi:hypothetical protein
MLWAEVELCFSWHPSRRASYLSQAPRRALSFPRLAGQPLPGCELGCDLLWSTARVFTQQLPWHACAFNCSAWRADCAVTRIYHQPRATWPSLRIPPTPQPPPWRTTKASTRTGCLCTPSPSRSVPQFSRTSVVTLTPRRPRKCCPKATPRPRNARRAPPPRAPTTTSPRPRRPRSAATSPASAPTTARTTGTRRAQPATSSGRRPAHSRTLPRGTTPGLSATSGTASGRRRQQTTATGPRRKGTMGARRLRR